MSDEPRYDEGGEPTIRTAPRGEHRHLLDFPCPYCGSKSVLISLGDIKNDKYRVELYCDNSMCDVREMVVLPKRTNEPVAWSRADVAALRIIDDGTEAEQEAEGYELHRDARGEVKARAFSFKEAPPVDLSAMQERVLKRRQRKSRIRIEPEVS